MPKYRVTYKDPDRHTTDLQTKRNDCADSFEGVSALAPEYLTIEIDTDAGTAVVVQKSKKGK